MLYLSMVIDNFHIFRIVAHPLEANPILIINRNSTSAVEAMIFFNKNAALVKDFLGI